VPHGEGFDEWNRLRKGKNAINKIEVIELRTDPKYGKFISHKPASAKVSITKINIVTNHALFCTIMYI